MRNNIIFVKVDKASIICAILWKKNYVDKVNKELNNDSFYIKFNQNFNPIHKKCIAYKKKCKSLFFYNFNLSNHHTFTSIFMTPKFSKTPVKFRFICSISKNINRNFNIVLQNLLKKKCDFPKCKLKNSSYFLSVDNGFEVLDKMYFIPRFIQIFDFINLFNNIIRIRCMMLWNIFFMLSILEKS